MNHSNKHCCVLPLESKYLVCINLDLVSILLCFYFHLNEHSKLVILCSANVFKKTSYYQIKVITVTKKPSQILNDDEKLRWINQYARKNKEVLIVFDDMLENKELQKKENKTKENKTIVSELFRRERKLNISLVFISQSYSSVPKGIRLNATHYFIMKIFNKRELQEIPSNYSSNIEFKDFMRSWVFSLKKIVLWNHFRF